MGIVQQRQRRAHPAVHFRPPTHPAKFDADVVAQHSYVRCGCISRMRHSMVARRPDLEVRASGTNSRDRRFERPNGDHASLEVAPSSTPPSCRLFFFFSFIVSPSFLLHPDRQRTKRLSAWGLGMGICLIVTNDRRRETTRPTYGVWASWLPSYERPERSA